MEKAAPRVLDVTFRDGGYLNDWRFDARQMRTVVAALAAAGIDLCEVGYLSDERAPGIAAACPTDLLEELRATAPGLGLVGMLRPREPAREVLGPRARFLDLVRVPTAPADPGPALASARVATELGLSVSCNLTNVSVFSEDEILSAVRTIVESGAVDCIYLADSRGAQVPEDVTSLVKRLRAEWDGRLGYHGHDSLGLALSNSAAGLAAGCDMVDGSLSGYGIGGQNTDLAGLVELAWDGRPEAQTAVRQLRSLAAKVALPPPREGHEMYRLAAQCNINMEWVPPLVARLGGRAAAVLSALPRRRYRSIEAMWETIDDLSNAGLQG